MAKADIERVEPKNRTLYPVYDSADGSYDMKIQNEEARRAARERQEPLAALYNNLSEGHRTKTLDIWESARTPNSFNVNAQQALNPFMKLKSNQNVAFFDIEALGTPEHLRVGKGIDLFAVTELSFGGTRFSKGEFVKSKENIVSMAIAPGKKEYQRMKDQIQLLKQNPMMGVSQDMHRTLLDLAKYSNVNHFKTAQFDGKAYTSLLEHKRVPSAGAAFTRKTIEEIEMGLENLYSKGTKLSQAMSIFEGHVKKTGSLLGGYNIHAYDLPALMSTVKNKSTKRFLETASKNSLDFYHAYSATTKNPYSLTGASLRQEHIHQYLLGKGDIKSGKQAGKGKLPSYLYHLAADDIQANIELAGFTNKHIQGFIEEAKRTQTYAFSPSSIKTNPLQVGQEVFSFQSGMFDPVKQKHTLVGRMNGDRIEARWSNLDTSLPSNERFFVKEFLKDVLLPNSDQKGFGVRLDSKDITGKSILMFSETEAGLAQQIHGAFLPMNNEATKQLRNIKLQDHAFREYENMFDQNGFKKMNELYGHLNSAGNAGKDFDWKTHILNRGGSDELAMKFPHLVNRLEGEKEVWENVMKRLNHTALSDDQKSIALRHIKNRFDQLGDNKASLTAEGSKFFNFTFGKDDEMVFNAKNTEQIKNSFRSLINGGRRGERVGNPEKTYKIARIDELSSLIINNFGFSAEGQEAKKVRAIAEGMVQEVHSGNKIETALTSMANFVRDHVETKGNSSFVREVTDRVTDKRSKAIRSLMADLPEVVQDSINYSQSHAKAKDAINGNSKLKEFLQKQDEHIHTLFQKNFGLHSMNDASTVKKAGSMAAKYEDLVGKIISAYSNDFNTQIRFMEGGNPLLILADKKSGMNMSELKTYEEIVRNPRLASIELPSFDADQKVRWGSSRKAAVIRSGVRNSEAYHSTTVTDALNMILDYSKKAKELSLKAQGTGRRNPFVEIQQGLRYRVSRQVDPVPSSANRKLGFEDANMFELRSAIAGEVRSSRWDVTGFAELWYRRNQSRLGFNKTVDDIASIAKEKGVSFFDAMDNRAKGLAIAGGLMETAKSIPGVGLKGSMFGMNNRAAGMGYIGTAGADARTYMALGNYYSDSVENPHKTINYRALSQEHASAALKKAGKDGDYRYKNSFISSAAHEALERNNEWRGLTMKTGYMTDEEIALKLKDAKKVNEYKQMIDKSDAPEYMKRQMTKALDMGMLSTSEGLAFMDYRLMSAFDGIDEVRINVKADSVSFNNTIEEAIKKQAEKQGIEDWKTKGIKFDKPLEIDISSMLDKNGKLTVGEYTINSMVTAPIVDEKRFRKGDKVTLLGFNADDPSSRSLVLGRERRTGHGFKAVTESGFRATMVPMLGEVMSDLYGQKGIEQVISHLGEKKGVNDLAGLIRGYDTVIREKYGASAAGHLSKYYEDVEKTLGIRTKLEKNGQYTVASDFGLSGQELSYEAREQFSANWRKNLGLNREVFGELTMAHDVWNRQGGLNNAKITIKEIEMLDRSYRSTKLAKPGESSAHVDWLRETVYGAGTTGEIKAQQKVFSETVKAALNHDKGWTPKAGDAVIDYTSDGMGIMTDVNAQLKDGVLHVSKDSFEQIPMKSAHNQMFTVGDYAKTVLNAGAVNYNLKAGGQGEKLQKFLLRNNGTAYMKLPEFAANQYIPLIDVDSMKLPSDMRQDDKVQFLDSVKGHYAKIARKMDEYNSTFVTNKFSEEQVAKAKSSLADEINMEASRLIQTLGDSTSKEGMSRIMARRLDNSSQYQFGGVNPLLAYQKEDGKWVNKGMAREGHIYMNVDDVRNLVGDNAENIAKSWGVDTSNIKSDEMTDWVLKNWNKHDTYSTAIRYPSIDTGTTQSLKLKISEAVGNGQVVGLPGMAERISGDFDGDNIAVILSQYGIKDDERRAAVLNDMARLNRKETAKNLNQAAEIMSGHEASFRSSLAKITGLEVTHKDIVTASEQFFSGSENLTLGSLHGDEARERIREAVAKTGQYGNWGIAKNGEFTNLALEEHEKSVLARSTSTTIGSVDNTRMRMSAAFMSLSETKYKLFNQAEGALKYTQDDYVRETAIVDEFLREYSQKSISAKKVEGSALTSEEVMKDLYAMIDKVNNPSNNLDYGQAAADLADRGLFKNKPFLEIGDGEVYRGSRESFMKTALELLGGAEETFGSMGVNGNRQSSLMMFASQGIGFDKLSNVVRTGEHLPGTEGAGYLNRVAKELGYESMDAHRESLEKAVFRAHTSRLNNITDRFEDSGNVMEIMNGQSRNPGILPNSEVPVYRTIRDQMDNTLAEIATQAKAKFSGSAAGVLGVATAGFASLWATNAAMKGAPTPEGLQEMAPVAPETLGAPTARVAQNDNGEYLNIRINAKSAQRMSSNDIAALINNEVMAMSNMKMATNVNVNDNSKQIDRKWLENQVANAMNKGYAY
ncbi:hypothetical protein [Cytobacillus oceanisediminis]|uniref:hypothetical protein n=1 Tax=Cytobacillus oceanisediminis TaxID=665099 RepID=UPI001FB36151|nr:hypothetical protein [Cytobacillus oceanisediminis]UOE58081.1 hypothetical protein IRB79_27855 [Cytobacillus oceanisediminis]